MSYKNTKGISIDFDGWVASKEASQSMIDQFTVRTTDIGGMYYLDSKIEFTGFMLGPVATYKGRAIEARSRKITNPEEFVEYCKNTNNKIFLYDLIYHAGMPKYAEVNLTTFEMEALETPIVTNTAGWTVRYGELD